jgi:outer membrane protein TolC
LTQQRFQRQVISRSDALESGRQKVLAASNLQSAVAALTASYIAIQKSLGLGWQESTYQGLATDSSTTSIGTNQ